MVPPGASLSEEDVDAPGLESSSSLELSSAESLSNKSLTSRDVTVAGEIFRLLSEAFAAFADNCFFFFSKKRILGTTARPRDLQSTKHAR